MSFRDQQRKQNGGGGNNKKKRNGFAEAAKHQNHDLDTDTASYAIDYVEEDEDSKLLNELKRLAEDTISKIQRDAKFFDDCEKKLGTDKDTRKLRTEIKNRVSSATKTIKETAAHLKRLSTPKNAETRRSFDKLKREIADCFQNFDQLQKIQQMEKSIVLKEKAHVEQLKLEKDNAIDEEHEREQRRQQQEQEKVRLLEYQKKKQESQLLDNQISHNEKLITEREEDILQIEEDIREIHQTFKEMNILVKHQQVGLDLIEENVERTVIHVKEGTKNLEKANTYDKRSRNLTCIIMLIVLILAVVLAGILVLVLKVSKVF